MTSWRLMASAGLSFLFASARALACASCGSGGDAPMVLFPNEIDKVYVGVAHGTGYQEVDADGAFATAGGPDTKDSLTVSYGHSFTTRFFMTLTEAYLRNELAGQSEDAYGDPFLAARYTVVMPSVVEPWMPQVQLLVGYKKAVARSIYQSRELATQLDVFGNGFDEAKAGVDLWFGQLPLQFGGAAQLIVPLPRTFNGVKYTPGLGSRWTGTIGHAWDEEWKTDAGFNIEQHAPLHAEGVSDSSQLDHALFLTADYMPTLVDDVRVSMAQQAAFGENKNTMSATIFTLAYMRAF